MSSQTFLPDIQWIAKKAAEDPEFVYQGIAHHLDEKLLKEAFHRLRKDAAPGIDGQTAAEYAEGLSENLRDLHERLRTRTYRATSIKRTWIPKEDGSQRPIGTLILEDTIVQKAVAMLLEEVFEQDFYDVSYGFRPGRSPHKALHAVRELIQRLNIGWILDVDIRQFFDTVDRDIFFDLLHRRVKDGGVDRLLGKWFNVGILDGDQLSYTDLGTPQGGVISPMIANIYLHYVLDDWFIKEVKPRLKGRCFLIRFADDAILGFEYEEDARRVAEVLPKRFDKYGLCAHPEKTRVVTFVRPKYGAKKDRTNGTCDFLGFTHYLARSRHDNWVVKRRTIHKRLRRAMSRFAEWCKFNRHLSVKEQWEKLSQKLRGYDQYYGIRGNYDSLYWVYYTLRFAWRRWLSRRSQKGFINWKKFQKILDTYPLPKPRIVQKWV
ncbi:MAG: group II intron reverse transcriptase/maturase [Gammaproteobacteria bacterium]|nr:group II intron reverse transcriptase/maturase [Gammaproteobacteria bacterium]